MAYDVSAWRRQVVDEDLEDTSAAQDLSNDSLPDLATLARAKLPRAPRPEHAPPRTGDGTGTRQPYSRREHRQNLPGSSVDDARPGGAAWDRQKVTNLPSFKKIQSHPQSQSQAQSALHPPNHPHSRPHHTGYTYAPSKQPKGSSKLIDLTESPPSNTNAAQPRHTEQPRITHRQDSRRDDSDYKHARNPYRPGFDNGFDRPTVDRVQAHEKAYTSKNKHDRFGLADTSAASLAQTIATLTDASGDSDVVVVPSSQLNSRTPLQGLSAKARIASQIQSENRRKGIPIGVPSKHPPAAYYTPAPLNDLTPNSPHSKISSNINKNASGRNWEDDDANQASSSRNNNPEDALKELVRQAYGETNMEDVDFGASMPKGLRCQLLPHQITGVQWMRSREQGKKKGGILADDMGLGKTVQSIALMIANEPTTKQVKTTLIVCPLSVTSQWKEEIVVKTEKELGLKIYVHQGSGRTKDPNKLMRQNVVITTYQTVQSEMAQESKEINSKGKSKSRQTNLDGFLVSDSDNDDADDKKLKKKFTKEKDAGPLFEAEFYRVILDEAHNIKNRLAKTSKACCALKSQYRWCLTGTPIQNSVDDMFSLFAFLGPTVKPLNDYQEFKSRIGDPHKRGKSPVAIQRLKVILSAVMLRRTKDTTIDSKPIFVLPPKEIIEVKTDFMDPDERVFYDALRDKIDLQLNKFLKAGSLNSNYMGVLTLLLRLRQACSHPHLVSGASGTDVLFEAKGAEKANALESDKEVEDLADALAGFGLSKKTCSVCLVELNSKTADTINDKNCKSCKENMQKYAGLQFSTKIQKTIALLDEIKEEDPTRKTIIFSQFTSMLDLLEPFLRKGGHKFVRLDGSMAREHRAAALDKIKTSSRYNVILISIKSGAVGLNLTCCSVVILLDLWWNPAIENQAIDRAYRFGQTRNVTVYKVTIANTIEDRILLLQQQKQGVADSVLDGGASKNRLTARDMMMLFKHD